MFGKKTAADVLKLFSLLSDEEKAKVLDGLKLPETKDEEQPAEVEEHVAEKDEKNGTAEQAVQGIDEESVGEQENIADDEDGQPAEEQIAESEGAEDPEGPMAEPSEEVKAEAPASEPVANDVDYGEVTQALAARISSLEEKLAAMEQKLADDVAKDNNQDFGSSPSLPTHDDGNSRMAEVMNNYAGVNARKYY